MAFLDQTRPPGPIALTFGVILPAAIIVLEFLSGLCAQVFFDPLPTFGHLLAVGAVPAVNFGLWRALRAETAPPGWLIPAAAATILVSIGYVILFLPILPYAIVAIAFMGIGILPFAPVMTLIAGLRWTSQLNGRVEKCGRKLALGLLAGLALILLVDLPASATHFAVSWADRGPEEERRAVALMRAVGSRDLLLRLCYGDTRRPTGLIAFMFFSGVSLLDDGTSTVNSSTARTLYFRTTGKSFNSVEPPIRGFAARPRSILRWDEDRGGEGVGGRVEGLSLASSRIDGSISGADNLGYLEWTAEIRNGGTSQQEARLTLAMPEGAVASRATLWINVEPREALVAARSEARAAYQRVVNARRDPLLVTTNGAGRLLIQAFPIPAGGRIKFRVGFTAPLTISRNGARKLALPAIVERNFDVPSALRHSIWVEAKERLATSEPGFTADLIPGGTRLRALLPDAQLLGDRPRIMAPPLSAPIVRSATAPAADGIREVHVTQTIAPTSPILPDRLTILFDGSAGNRPAAAALDEALSAIPARIPVGLVIADDDIVAIPAAPWSPRQQELIHAAIAATSFTGGKNNVEALAEALSRAGGGQGVLLWIHGPQPEAFNQSSARLAQLFDRKPDLPQLVRYQPVAGPSFTLPYTPWFDWARNVTPSTDMRRDLTTLLADLTSRQPRWQVSWRHGDGQGTPGSAQILRLWAADRIAVSAGKPGTERDAALALARRFNLVTPLSGAVVLETAQDYRDNQLPEPSATDVPSVPEPETWVLIAVVVLLMAWQLRRRSLALAA